MATLTPPQWIARLLHQDKEQLTAWIETLKVHPEQLPAFLAWWEERTHG